jgi:hypothetical protein
MLEPRHWGKKIVVGLVLTLIGAFSIGSYEGYESRAIHTKGTVLELQQESQRTGRRGNTITSFRPLVRFTIPGTEKTMQLKTVHASARYDFAIGSNVDIEFDPSSPEQTLRIDTGISFLDLGVCLVGLTTLGFGVYEKVEWEKFRKKTV